MCFEEVLQRINSERESILAVREKSDGKTPIKTREALIDRSKTPKQKEEIMGCVHILLE